MRNRIMLFTFLEVLFLTLLSGCSIIGDIFQAGVWVGIILVIAVIAIIVFIISKIRRKG